MNIIPIDLMDGHKIEVVVANHLQAQWLMDFIQEARKAIEEQQEREEEETA